MYTDTKVHIGILNFEIIHHQKLIQLYHNLHTQHQKASYWNTPTYTYILYMNPNIRLKHHLQLHCQPSGKHCISAQTPISNIICAPTPTLHQTLICQNVTISQPLNPILQLALFVAVPTCPHNSQ